MWPTVEVEPFNPHPDMTTYLTLERHLAMENQKVRSPPIHRNVRGHRPRRKPVAARVDIQPSRPNHALRRTSKFLEGLKECVRSSKSAEQKRSNEEDSLMKLYTVRDAIRAGKLEVVVPPSGSTNNGRAGPPPRSQAPTAKPRSLKAARSNTATQPSKVGKLIDRGADILGETRKELVGKFKPPFEHISYHSFTRSHRDSRYHSNASDKSFCCIGEKEIKPSQVVQALKGRQQQNSWRPSYEGGQGTNPWVDPPPRACRLCKKPGIRDIRGLCNDCENDFVRPKTQRYTFVDPDVEGDIKPTPPLKDLETLLGRSTLDPGAECKSVPHSGSNEVDQKHTQGSGRAELKMTNANNYPRTINPAIRRESQQAVTEGKDDDELLTTWQALALNDEYERTKSVCKRWSACHETDDHETWTLGSDDESARLVNWEQQRDSKFYRFYDDLLSHHVSKAPLGGRNHG